MTLNNNLKLMKGLAEQKVELLKGFNFLTEDQKQAYNTFNQQFNKIYTELANILEPNKKVKL